MCICILHDALQILGRGGGGQGTVLKKEKNCLIELGNKVAFEQDLKTQIDSVRSSAEVQLQQNPHILHNVHCETDS